MKFSLLMTISMKSSIWSTVHCDRRPVLDLTDSEAMETASDSSSLDSSASEFLGVALIRNKVVISGQDSKQLKVKNILF